jgi:V/A-type H+-transporting ATPase subunit E
MNAPVRVEDLQNALIARAKTLADQYLIRARRDRDLLLVEAGERSKQRDEREQAAARAGGERAYRQQVQAEELKLRADMDRLRWVHVQAVMDALRERLADVTRDETNYHALLRELIVNAARSIEADALVVQLNTHDYARLNKEWADFVGAAVPGKTLTLSDEPNERSGGAIVRSADDTIRVDNSFEGRIARFEAELEQVIIERLFAQAAPMGAIFNG